MNTPHQARPLRPRKWAAANATAELISVDTWSGYARKVMDPDGAQYDMRPDISDETLGIAVLDCLSRSRFLETEELRAQLYDFEAGQRNYLMWIDRLLRFGGYKTRRALFKHMASCGIEQENGVITIRPSHHEKLEGWSGQGFSDSDYVVISTSASPAEIGAALREAFKRCM